MLIDHLEPSRLYYSLKIQRLEFIRGIYAWVQLGYNDLVRAYTRSIPATVEISSEKKFKYLKRSLHKNELLEKSF